MATRQPARTPPRIIWGLIDAEMTAQNVSRAEIAKRIGVHINTVHTDAADLCSRSWQASSAVPQMICSNRLS